MLFDILPAMFRPTELFIGLRYIYARRGKHLIAFISMTAIVATALGIAVLLTILSIMNGFEGELRGRIVGMAAHLDVDTRHLEPRDFAKARDLIKGHAGIQAVSPYIERDVLVQRGGAVRAVLARGVDMQAETAVTKLQAHLVAGDLTALARERFQAVIGSELAQQLGLRVGDSLTVLSPRPRVTPAGLLPVTKRFVVAGIFEFGLNEHDGGLVLMARHDAARLFRSGESIDGIKVRANAGVDVPAIKNELRGETHLDITDWGDTHQNLYRALKTEKVVMFVILALAIAIAAFNVVAILVVAVNQKRGDIAMLNAMGMSRSGVLRVFLYQGCVMASVGVILGLVLGAVLAYEIDSIVAFVESSLGFKIFSPEVYYISSIPSDPRQADFIATAIFAFLLALVAPLYPAFLAAGQDPGEGLRYE